MIPQSHHLCGSKLKDHLVVQNCPVRRGSALILHLSLKEVWFVDTKTALDVEISWSEWEQLQECFKIVIALSWGANQDTVFINLNDLLHRSSW